MKFLYFGDAHYRATSPKKRLDDYVETLFEKTKEIRQLGEKYQVDAYLQPGDFFDTAQPPLDYVSKVLNAWFDVDFSTLLNFLKQAMQGEKINASNLKYKPMIGIAGNHELFGNNIQTLPRTMIGFLHEMGFMQFATKENPVLFTTKDGVKVAITGSHYHLDVDTPDRLDDYIVEEKLGDVHIHLVHGMLSDKSMGKLIRHTTIDQIKHTKADLTISGHDHIGFPLTEVDGKYFVNPGGLTRLSASQKEMNRTVKVLLIDISKEGLKLKEIPLRSAKKGNMVLDRSVIEERATRQMQLEEFKKDVRQQNMKQSTSIIDILTELMANEKVTEEMKNNLIDRVSEKMEEFQPKEEFHSPGKITKVVLENFQSHKNTEINLSDGFNLFIGESGQGKSAIIRAFRWVYENKPSGKRVITHGEDYARVTLIFENGLKISRYVEAKQSGKNGYEIYNPKTGEVEFSNTKILPEIQKLLTYEPFRVDNDLEFNLNFLRQGTGWFLIGEEYTAPTKAKILGGIFGTQYADAVARDLEKENKNLLSESKLLKEEIEETEEKLKRFSYLNDVENVIKEYEDKLEQVEVKINQKETFVSLALSYKETMKRKEEIENVLEQIKDVHVFEKYANVKEKVSKLESMNRLSEKYTKYLRAYKNLIKTINQTKNIKTALGLLEEGKAKTEKFQLLEKRKREVCALEDKIKEANNILLGTTQIEEAQKQLTMLTEKEQKVKELLQKHERLQKATQVFKKNQKALFYIEKTDNATKNIPVALEKIKSIEEKLRKKDVIQKIVTETKTIQMNRNEAILKGKEAERQINVYIVSYQETLKNIGRCPTCYGTVDNATISRIVDEYKMK